MNENTANSTRVVVRNVRFSYVHVFEKDDFNNKYSVSLLFSKNDREMVEEIKGAIKAAVVQGAGKLGPNFKLDAKTIVHDGDVEKAGDEAYAGMYYLNAKSDRKPGIVKKNTTGMGGKTTDITDPEEFYSGCYGYASVTFFAFNTGVNKGIGVALNNLLKIRDGEPLGSSQSAEDELGGYVDADGDLPGGNAEDDMAF